MRGYISSNSTTRVRQLVRLLGSGYSPRVVIPAIKSRSWSRPTKAFHLGAPHPNKGGTEYSLPKVGLAGSGRAISRQANVGGLRASSRPRLVGSRSFRVVVTAVIQPRCSVDFLSPARNSRKYQNTRCVQVAWKLLDAYPAQMEAARSDGTLPPAKITLGYAASQGEVQVSMNVAPEPAGMLSVSCRALPPTTPTPADNEQRGGGVGSSCEFRPPSQRRQRRRHRRRCRCVETYIHHTTTFKPRVQELAP